MTSAGAITRQSLVTAALAEFLEKGWERTRGDAIRKRASASNGSWRHFFPTGKIGVAETIYSEMSAVLWQKALANFEMPFAAQPSTLIIKAHKELLGSIQQSRSNAKFYFELGIALEQTSAADIVHNGEKSRRDLLAAWVNANMSKQQVAPPPELCWGFVFGPAIDLCRLWAIGQVADMPPGVAKHLSDAAVCILFNNGRTTGPGTSKTAKGAATAQGTLV